MKDFEGLRNTDWIFALSGTAGCRRRNVRKEHTQVSMFSEGLGVPSIVVTPRKVEFLVVAKGEGGLATCIYRTAYK